MDFHNYMFCTNVHMQLIISCQPAENPFSTQYYWFKS